MAIKINWKRLCRAVAISLLVGLVLTVVAAGASSWWVRVRFADLCDDAYVGSGGAARVQTYRRPGVRWVAIHTTVTPTELQQLLDDSADLLPFIGRLPAAAADQAFKWQTVEYVINARGWPLPALCSMTTTVFDIYDNGIVRQSTTGGVCFPITTDMANQSIIERDWGSWPYLPIWRGLIIDSLMYGSAILAFMAARRRFQERFFTITRRHVYRMLLASIVIGTLMTVTVAWCLAIWGDVETHPGGPEDVYGATSFPTGGHWYVIREAEPGASRWISIRDSTSFGRFTSGPEPITTAETVVPSWGTPLQENGRHVVEARGWPLICMWFGYQETRNGDQPRFDDIHGLVLGSDHEGGLIIVPCRIILVPFVCNMCLYAAGTLLLLVSIPGFKWWRGALRMTFRDLCPVCGYDYRKAGRASCSECGWGSC